MLFQFQKETVINSLTDIIMRLFERYVYKTEIVDIIKDSIDSDQYAYKKGHSSTMAL